MLDSFYLKSEIFQYDPVKPHVQCNISKTDGDFEKVTVRRHCFENGDLSFKGGRQKVKTEVFFFKIN